MVVSRKRVRHATQANGPWDEKLTVIYTHNHAEWTCYNIDESISTSIFNYADDIQIENTAYTLISETNLIWFYNAQRSEINGNIKWDRLNSSLVLLALLYIDITIEHNFLLNSTNWSNQEYEELMLPVATLPVYYCATLKWICVTCFLQYGMLHVKFVYSFSFKFLLGTFTSHLVFQSSEYFFYLDANRCNHKYINLPSFFWNRNWNFNIDSFLNYYNNL